MLSESTAHLVQQKGAVLGDHELVHIKGVDAPVPARRLLRIERWHGLVGRVLSSLVGRRWEMAILETFWTARSMVTAVSSGWWACGYRREPSGPGGRGDGRQPRCRGVLVVLRVACQRDSLPCRGAAGARGARGGRAGWRAARAQVRVRVPGADEQDLVLLDDLLGIADPDTQSPKIDPDARRRRLTALINAAQLARVRPAVYIIEDAHWIDEVSGSMLAEFMTVIPQTRSMVLITYRPGSGVRGPGGRCPHDFAGRTE